MKEVIAWTWLVLCLMFLVAGVGVGVAIMRALWRLGPTLTAVMAGIEAANRREERANRTLAKVETAAVDAKAAIETAATVAATVAVGTKDEIKQTIRDEIHSKTGESHH